MSVNVKVAAMDGVRRLLTGCGATAVRISWSTHAGPSCVIATYTRSDGSSGEWYEPTAAQLHEELNRIVRLTGGLP